LVCLNHLKSKSQDGALFGENQPPEEVTLDQRVDQAQAINDYVLDLLSTDPDANIIVLGDMNDFQFSDTLETLADGGDGTAELTNLIDVLATGEDPYTFIFNGNSQVLDHILVSDNLMDKPNAPAIDIVHTNLDFGFPIDNASDHDPVVALIDMSNELTLV
jgi:predicted extracellular nuclease